MLNVWSLCVIALNLRVLSTTIPLSRSEEVQKTVRGTVFPTNAPNPTMTNIDPDLLQLLCHPGPAITAKTEAQLFLDVGQNDHVRMLCATGRAAPKGPQPPRANVHNLTQPVCCEAAAFAMVA